MPMIGIYGMVGSGKGIINTIDNYYIPKEIPIFCNYHSNLKNAQFIEPEEVFEVFEEDKLTPVKVLDTDEATMWYENRNSGTKDSNAFFSFLMFQSRKMGLYWKSTAQLRGTLDIRWRGQENKVIYAHERELDMAGNSLDDFHFTVGKRTVNGIIVRNIGLKYKKAQRFFGLYNTKEKITSQEFRDLKEKIQNKNADTYNKFLDDLTKEFYDLRLKEIPFKVNKDGSKKYLLTQERVRDVLIRMGKNPEYASSVKVRIEDLILRNQTEFKLEEAKKVD